MTQKCRSAMQRAPMRASYWKERTTAVCSITLRCKRNRKRLVYTALILSNSWAKAASERFILSRRKMDHNTMQWRCSQNSELWVKISLDMPKQREMYFHILGTPS
jgi:hypothetical protein